MQTYWFRCDIPEDERQAQRIAWTGEIAFSLGNEGEVHFSSAISEGSTVYDVLYSGGEDPRLLLTTLYLATGERFHLHSTWTSRRASFARPV